MNTLTDQIATPAAPPFVGQPCPDVTPAPMPAPVLPRDPWQSWDAFLLTTEETGFMQTSWWAEFRSRCGFGNFGVTLKDGSDVVGGAVVQKYIFRADTPFYYIQDGPVLPADPEAAEAVFNAILAEIDQHRESEPIPISHLRIEPRWLNLPDFVRGFRPIRPLTDHFLEARDTRCIDLRPSEAEILAQMKPKGRYNIGVARRHGVTVVEDSSARGITDFMRIYRRMVARQGLWAKPAEYFRELLEIASPRQRASLFFAEYQGRRLATALVMYFGNRATYFYGASLDIYRRVMAPYLLHFEIMRKARARGMHWYDFWGIPPRNEPDHPWTNIGIFKAKFGGAEVHLVPSLDLVYDAAAYERYVAFNPRKKISR
jgi:lipid II:glycine glycyltransferase (peptidoglycan interpeptide bridge formation enzyme)